MTNQMVLSLPSAHGYSRKKSRHKTARWAYPETVSKSLITKPGCLLGFLAECGLWCSLVADGLPRTGKTVFHP